MEKKKGVAPPTLILFVGKWEERKGVKKLLRAYHTEFKPSENVLLVLLTNAYHSTNEFNKEIAAYLREQGMLGKGPPYTVLTGLPQVRRCPVWLCFGSPRVRSHPGTSTPLLGTDRCAVGPPG